MFCYCLAYVPLLLPIDLSFHCAPRKAQTKYAKFEAVNMSQEYVDRPIFHLRVKYHLSVCVCACEQSENKTFSGRVP